MSSPLPEPLEEGVKIKRSRYNVQYDYELDKQEISKERLEIASAISNSSTMTDSMWLKNSSEKIHSSDVIVGNVLIIPVDKQDEGEMSDDAWVTSSNWYYCYIK